MAKVGLEPTRIATLDFESSASAIPPLGLRIDYRRKDARTSREVRLDPGPSVVTI